MKWFFWTLIFLCFFTPIIYIGKGVDHLDIMKDRYKRALDAGASAAVRAIPYSNANSIDQSGTGFGEKQQHGNNLMIDKDEALSWFYKVLYRNLGIEEDPLAQQRLKHYIPMKAIVGFDRLMIADVDDQWLLERYYDTQFNGVEYRFTMSEHVMQKSSGVWGKDRDFGMTPDIREALINRHIRNTLTEFLNDRIQDESGNQYTINIADSDNDLMTENISGISFIVMVEGMPLPTLNPWENEKYYAFALGGSELYRSAE